MQLKSKRVSVLHDGCRVHPGIPTSAPFQYLCVDEGRAETRRGGQRDWSCQNIPKEPQGTLMTLLVTQYEFVALHCVLVFTPHTVR